MVKISDCNADVGRYEAILSARSATVEVEARDKERVEGSESPGKVVRRTLMFDEAILDSWSLEVLESGVQAISGGRVFEITDGISLLRRRKWLRDCGESTIRTRIT